MFYIDLSEKSKYHSSQNLVNGKIKVGEYITSARYQCYFTSLTLRYALISSCILRNPSVYPPFKIQDLINESRLLQTYPMAYDRLQYMINNSFEDHLTLIEPFPHIDNWLNDVYQMAAKTKDAGKKK